MCIQGSQRNNSVFWFGRSHYLSQFTMGRTNSLEPRISMQIWEQHTITRCCRVRSRVPMKMILVAWPESLSKISLVTNIFLSMLFLGRWLRCTAVAYQKLGSCPAAGVRAATHGWRIPTIPSVSRYKHGPSCLSQIGRMKWHLQTDDLSKAVQWFLCVVAVTFNKSLQQLQKDRKKSIAESYMPVVSWKKVRKA